MVDRFTSAANEAVVTFPGSPFRLHQPFPPAGDQPAAIAQLMEGLEDGLSYQTLLGVTGSGKTYTMANVIARSGRPALVLAPNKTLAAQLYAEFREFFPENAVEYFVSYYDYYQPEAYVPSRDLFIEKDSSINEHIEQMRLSATKSLIERTDCIIVATVSCIYGIGDRDEYHQMIMHVREGDKVAQRDLLKRLAEMQYTRNEMDFQRGTFRVRGDVIDVFPAEHAEHAVRIELFDDEIERIQLFDPLTGQIRQRLPRFTVYPSSHYVTPRATVMRAIEGIKDELNLQKAAFLAEAKLVEAQRIEQRTKFDIEMLSEIGFCKGIENYSRHLSGRKAGEPPPTLIDYLPDNALIFIDESHVAIGQVGGMYRGDRLIGGINIFIGCTVDKAPCRPARCHAEPDIGGQRGGSLSGRALDRQLGLEAEAEIIRPEKHRYGFTGDTNPLRRHRLMQFRESRCELVVAIVPGGGTAQQGRWLGRQFDLIRHRGIN